MLVRDNAAEARVLQGGSRPMAGQHKPRAGVVVSEFMSQRANQRDVAHNFRGARQMLADLHARDARRNGLEGTADFAGRIGLGIESVEMAGSAVEPDQNAG